MFSYGNQRRLRLVEWQKLFELFFVIFAPSLDLGEVGNVGEESEEDEGEDGTKLMRHALFRAGIGNFFQTVNEEGKANGGRHFDLHGKRGNRKRSVDNSPTSEMSDCLENSENFDKNDNMKKTC